MRRLGLVWIASSLALCGGAYANGGWTIYPPGASALPSELMPRRYVDYPVAHALWRVLLAGTARSLATDDPGVLQEALDLSDELLRADGFSDEETAALKTRTLLQVSANAAAVDVAQCPELRDTARQLVERVIAKRAKPD